MRLRRREFLQLGGAFARMAGSSGCTHPRPELKLLPSLVPLPQRFQVKLPVPPVAKPSSADATTDYYEFDVQPAAVPILPGLETTIWGYERIFPGPTIEARRNRRVSLRLRNRLPVPIVHHLHGGRTAPESDGYPTDLILPEAGFADLHMHDPLARIARGQREVHRGSGRAGRAMHTRNGIRRGREVIAEWRMLALTRA